ncbi:universal stress protein [Rhodococcus sp. BP-349]|jgi:nucleotide-binding universal stress UspA family protein|uniref:Nucleotide-binding universal stress UspA family protein n=1 Tax=Rhodococcoides corynebacterioides TaxID=53972 RepID=A0ABS2KVJ2_9NOCA|nr:MULTISPECIES: universal stress protein [Rhodococcus]KQU36461.1 universal stress protein [Rhodococcus sp. Leaf225]KQU49008.1 universal stress protein [Rhodococcus sp. Leaf258]MBM7415967.1 nucleotide-binding universal stress UspA family protein [Rhodococcus corynebacterioides]MBP1114220.1 nucleotide-binding universal stress UspA family protein [Rhodococcus sp. PvP016]MBY6539914.1 universal stress protein [Rhodococcus sp. BP-363]
MSVVVGYADTVEDRNALPFAFREAKMRGTDVTVVVDGDRSAVDELIMAARTDSGADGVAARVAEPVPGRSHADNLVDMSYEPDVELLVIGVRRRSPVGKLLLGSLSQRVLLDAHCPVVAVKPPVEVAH